MKRENRYIVLKHSDIEAVGLTPNEVDALEEIMFKISEKRRSLGKDRLKCVVVESDWPEYEPTWKAIKERATRKEKERKFKTMFGDSEIFDYYYIVKNHNGEFIITSDAASPTQLTIGECNYRLLYSGRVHNLIKLDYKQVMTTSWSTNFDKVVQVSFDELIALYDPYIGTLYSNIAEFMNNKLDAIK